ncbi:MAG: hypothetical protein KDB27_10535, partial [Planctomycetales bacterium]|nr:hypothetical protein [Planctomycetales bacterium]
GDANRDFYFDEADFIQAMKSGKFDTGESATWDDGDWSQDGEFTSRDFMEAFVDGEYLQGAYSDDATDPVNELAPFATDGDPDVTVYYDAATGNLTAVADVEMTTLHIVSTSGQLRDHTTYRGLFDVASSTSHFQLHPPGTTIWYLQESAPIGVSIASLQADLLVDGSMLAGGGLGTVVLADSSQMPADVPPPPPPVDTNQPPTRPDRPAPNDPFVDASEANAVLTYDPATGDITITGIDGDLTSIELISADGILEGTFENDYTEGLFDVATRYKLFRLNPKGFSSIQLEGIARKGLTYDEVSKDLTISGSTIGKDPLKVALSFADSRLRPQDFNGDYYVDEADVLFAMAFGKFEQDTVSLATEGDLNSDFRFDASDIRLLVESVDYKAGAYSDSASTPVDTRQTLSTSIGADFGFIYDATTGDVTLKSEREPISALHVASSMTNFRTVSPISEFGFADQSNYFAVLSHVSAEVSIPALLPPGMSQDEIIHTITIAGTLSGGGVLGSWVLSQVPTQTPFWIGDANLDSRVDPADLIQMMRNGWFESGAGAMWEDGDFDGDGDVDQTDWQAIIDTGAYTPNSIPYRDTQVASENTLQRISAEEQDVRFLYLPLTGSIVVDTAVTLTSLHVTSAGKKLIESGQADGPFDFDSSHGFFSVDPNGIDADEILLRLPDNMSLIELMKDLRVDGTRLDGAPFGGVSLFVIMPTRIETLCNEILNAGIPLGDVNFDGVFDSADLVIVFQAGEYRDEIPQNSNWYEGDWNCDGDFD